MLAALGDVPGGDDEAFVRARRIQGRAADQPPQDLAVLGMPVHLHGAIAVAGDLGVQFPADAFVFRVGGVEGPGGLAHDLVGGVAGHAAEHVVGFPDAPLLQQADADRGGFEDALDPVLAVAEIVQRLAQFGGPEMDPVPQDEVGRAQQQQQAGDEHDDRQPGVQNIPDQERGAHPFAVDGPVFPPRDFGETAVHQRQKVGTVFPDCAVELAGVEHEGLVEIVGDPVLVKVVDGRRLVHRENPELLLLGGLDDGLVAREFLQAVDAAVGQMVDDGVAGLDSDGEALQRGHVRDAAQGLVGEDRHLDGRVRRREAVVLLAFRRPEDRIDDVGAAILHDPLGLGPIHGLQLDLHAGLLLPEGPLVGDDALQAAVGAAENVGRIVVVADDHQGRARHIAAGAGGQKRRRRQGQDRAAGAPEPGRDLQALPGGFHVRFTAAGRGCPSGSGRNARVPAFLPASGGLPRSPRCRPPRRCRECPG